MKKIMVVLLALTALLTLWGVAFASVMGGDVIKAGTESTYPPYEFRDAENNLRGFDIELMETLADMMGKRVEWVDMPFDSLIPALLSKKIDIVAAGMSATPERAKRVRFSVPYEISLSTFIVKVDDQAIKTLEDVKGKVVAAQLGTVQETYAKSIEGVTVKSFQKFDDCVREVSLGRADATLMDRPVAAKFVKQKDFNEKVKLAFDQEITGAEKALAMNLGEKSFVKTVDEAMEELRASGKLDELRSKWFKE